VLPAVGVSFIYTLQVGQGPGPLADLTRRGHCSVMGASKYHSSSM
jgi:hypothetical protein